MQVVQGVVKHFFSYPFILVMLFILGAGAGVATFIESLFDTQTAKVLVYHATWYEIVMALLCFSMIGLMYKTKMWKRMLITVSANTIFDFGVYPRIKDGIG